MLEQRSSQVGRSLPASVFDKYQGIYNEQEQQLRQNDLLRKKLLASIMEKEQQQTLNRKIVNRKMENLQNKQIDLFWKNEEEKMKAMERKKRQSIQETRKVNSENFRSLLSKSMVEDPYHLQKSFRDDLNSYHEHERQKKEQMRQLYQQGMIADHVRQEKKRYDRELDYLIAKKKQKQDQELANRSMEYYKNWRNKHFQQKHPELINMIANINHQKEQEKAELEEVIAVRGSLEQSQRVAAFRVAEEEHRAAQRQQHLKKLKEQTEENAYKAAIDKYLELNYQRGKMNQLEKAMEEREMMLREQKKGMNNEHLKVLRDQMRPRVLQQQPDKIEAAGIGSPAHIGKIVHDDRIKQLKWLERSYLQELRQG